MHPDKNGGTDEAKKRFQGMRERYEELREEILSGRVSIDASRTMSSEDVGKENISVNQPASGLYSEDRFNSDSQKEKHGVSEESSNPESDPVAGVRATPSD